jgi:hypothetical protein
VVVFELLEHGHVSLVCFDGLFQGGVQVVPEDAGADKMLKSELAGPC